MRLQVIFFCVLFVAGGNPLRGHCQDEPAQDQGPELQVDHDIVRGIGFLATFDDVPDLNLSGGEGWISTAKTYDDIANRHQIQTHIFHPDAKIAEGQGRLGDALHFRWIAKQVLFYKADEFDFGVRKLNADWSTTVSIWVRLTGSGSVTIARSNRHAILMQLTQPSSAGPTLSIEHVCHDGAKSRQPNNELRLVVTQAPRDLGDDDDAAQTLVRVKRPPLLDDRWHHLVLAMNQVSARANEEDDVENGGIAAMYLDGRRLGRSRMNVPMTLNHKKAALVLGHGMVGYLDHLWMTSRVLSDREVRRAYERPELFR